MWAQAAGTILAFAAVVWVHYGERSYRDRRDVRDSRPLALSILSEIGWVESRVRYVMGPSGPSFARDLEVAKAHAQILDLPLTNRAAASLGGLSQDAGFAVARVLVAANYLRWELSREPGADSQGPSTPEADAQRTLGRVKYAADGFLAKSREAIIELDVALGRTKANGEDPSDWAQEWAALQRGEFHRFARKSRHP